MCHRRQHAVALHHASTYSNGEVVPGFGRRRCIYLNVGIDDDHVAHLAGSYVVHAHHPGSAGQRACDRCNPQFIDAAVHQLVQRILCTFPAHFCDHQANDQLGKGSSSGKPARLPAMPMPATSDQAASKRACQEFATSMLDLTFVALFSM